MRGLHLDSMLDTNPCFGCTSAGCNTCACAGERDLPDTTSVKVPVKKGKPASRHTSAKKSTTDKKKDLFAEAFGTKHDYVFVPSDLFGDVGDSFVVRADGDGMRYAGILSGDQVIFERDKLPESGDIVAGLVNGSLMCRRIFFEGENIRVRREDGETPDILTTDCVIFGVMVGLARNCRKAG